MSTPTIIERVVSLEPVTRDDFGDSPAPAPGPHRTRSEAHCRVAESRRSVERVLASLLVHP